MDVPGRVRDRPSFLTGYEGPPLKPAHEQLSIVLVRFKGSRQAVPDTIGIKGLKLKLQKN